MLSNMRPKVRDSLPLIITLSISFLGTISMTIVLPVLPFIIQDHMHDARNVGLWVGVLETVFSACALFSGPVLGALSDRIGRKPVLVVSLLGSAVGYVLFGVAGGLAVLALSRVIDGVTAGDRPSPWLTWPTSRRPSTARRGSGSPEP